MSFIVKGIDLPKDETITIHYANRYGEMETVFVDENDIIQIPKDHGRIIDESKIYCVDHDEYETPNIFETDAPTILEEEK